MKTNATRRAAVPTHVAVVGGGPAGSCAALALAQQGARVTLCEALRFPRSRPGESLPPAIEPLLAQLGLARELAAADFPRTAGVEVQWGGRSERRLAGQDARGVWCNYQAERSRFDALLLRAAERAGVEVREGVRPSDVLHSGRQVNGLVLEGRELRTDWVLDATGGAHWLARRLGLEIEPHSPPLHARYGYVSQVVHRARLAEPRLASDDAGWTWLAPLGAGRLAWVRLRWDGVAEPADWQPAELAGSRPEGGSRGADVTWRCVTEPAGPGYFCLGDAACVLDPLSSHGVLRAIMTGLQAAHLIGQIRRGASARQAADEYSRWLRGWFEHEVAALRSFYRQISPETVAAGAF
ncbi:MAG: tryptophan 7-halogenase [Verrucomicrobia bacterium]|nr:tryptophan 7-halogenase [Verrucomicrobiota bacterium]